MHAPEKKHHHTNEFPDRGLSVLYELLHLTEWEETQPQQEICQLKQKGQQMQLEKGQIDIWGVGKKHVSWRNSQSKEDVKGKKKN